MNLIRWSPVVPAARNLNTVHDEVERLFDSFFTRRGWNGDVQSAFYPAAEIQETPEAFVLKLDLPGVAQNDVKVNLIGDTLTIRGERKRETETKSGSPHRSERVYGAFERTFTLGASVRADQVKASYRDGVLEVRVPKAEEARMREIEIQVG